MADDGLQDDFEGFAQEREQAKLRALTYASPVEPPEKIGRAAQIARQRGVPTQAILDDFDGVTAAEEADRLARRSPRAAAFVGESPERFAMTRGDHDALVELDRAVAETDDVPWWEDVRTFFTRQRDPRMVTDPLQQAVSEGIRSAGAGVSGVGELYQAGERTTDRLLRAAFGDGFADALGTKADLPEWARAMLPGDSLVTLASPVKRAGEAVAVPEERRNFATEVGGAVGQIGATVLQSVVAPQTVVPTLFGQGADQGADQAREAGLYGTASGDAAITGYAAVTGVSEKIGLDALLNRVPPRIRNATVRWFADKFLAGAIEGAQEVAEQVGQNVVAQQTIDPEKPTGEGVTESFTVAGAAGAIVRMMLGARGRSPDAATQQDEGGQAAPDAPQSTAIDVGAPMGPDPSAPATAQAAAVLAKLAPSVTDAAKLVELQAAARAVKTADLDPGAVQRFVQEQVDRTPSMPSTVYLNAQQVVEYFQTQGEDAAASVAQMMGDPNALAEAMAGTGDLAIDTGAFVAGALRGPHGDALRDLARLAPDRLSNAELTAANVDDLVARFTDEVPEVPRGTEDTQTQAEDFVRESIRAQIDLSGRYDPAAAERIATTLARQLSVRAQRRGRGETARDLLDAYPVKIIDAEPSRTAPVDANLDPAIDDVLAKGLEPRSNTTGKTLVQAVIDAGGIDPDSSGADDLKQMGAQQRPGFFKRGGLTVEAMGELLAEQDSGWTDLFTTKDEYGRPELGEFRDKLVDALQGEGPRLADPAQAEFLAFRDQVAGAMRALQARGVDVATTGRPVLRQLVEQELGQEYEQPAYHGTPHNVDRFSLQKIGSGEGAISDPEPVFYQEALPDDATAEQLRARIAELEKELRTDALTGMRNRRAFDEDANLGWPTVAVLDLDGLKKVNDQLGHAAGDVLLTKSAEVMLAAESEQVRFYRQGGDEYTARFAEGVDPDAVMREVRDRLGSVEVVFDTPGGSFIYNGIGAGYGIGQDFQSADTAQNADKERRTAAGEREARGSDGPPRRLRRASDNQPGGRRDGDRAQPDDATQAPDGLAPAPEWYSVEARRAAYNPAQPSFDFEADPYENQGQEAPRVDASPEVLERGRAALHAVMRRHGATVLGDAIGREFATQTTAQLIGKQITGPEDLALLASIYRNPTFETIRYVFVDDAGTVLGESAYTSRMPSSGAVWQDPTGRPLLSYEAQIQPWLQQRQMELGATGFWLTHNHPSGNPNPSAADYRVTQEMRRIGANIGLELRGHVVTNHDRYGTIGQAPDSMEVHDLPAPGVDFRAEASIPHQFLGENVMGPEKVARVASAVANETGAALVIADAQGRVTMLASVDPAMLVGEDVARSKQTTKQRALASRLRYVITRSGGTFSFLVASQQVIDQSIGTLDSAAFHGLLTDVVPIERPGNSLAYKGVGGRTSDSMRNSSRSMRVMEVTDQTQTQAFRAWFGDSKVVDENGEPMVVYHSGKEKIERFDASKTVDGGFHFGTAEQANMRSGKRAESVAAFLSIENPRRSKDMGGNWKTKIASAKSAGHDGIVYLNRYEGMTIERINALQDNGLMDKLDRMSDAEFRRVVPEARDSYIAFRPEQIKSATANRGTFGPSDPSILNQQKRGSITLGAEEVTIRLGTDADLSTLHHEFGHLFLNGLIEDAFLEGADPQLARDLDIFLKESGATARVADGADAVRAAIGRDQHEWFAERYETYLFEGRSPSPAMGDLFARFRAWMLSVYGALRARNVAIPDAMRGVYDRLLATDAEIEAAHDQAGMTPLPDGVKALVPEARWAQYQADLQRAVDARRANLQAQVLVAERREAETWWQEELDALRTVVADEAMQDRGQRALALLSRGVQPDGSPLEMEPGSPEIRPLSHQALVAEFGPEFVKRLAGKRVTTKREGMLPVMAADLLGFRNTAELVESLANTQPFRAYVEAEALARMRAKHPDPKTDGTLPERALKAVHASKSLTVLETELALIAELAQQPAPQPRVLGAMARRIINAKPLRQVRPNDYLVAERAAAKEAMAALSKARPQLAVALAAKRRQVMNAHLYRAALEAKDTETKETAYLKRFLKPAKRKRLGKVGRGHLEAIDGLLEQIDLKQASGAEVRRRFDLLHYVEAATARGETITVPPAVLDLAQRTNVRDLSVDALRGIADTVRQADHLARRWEKVSAERDARTYEDIDEDMAAAVRAGAPTRARDRTGDKTLGERLAKNINAMDVARLLPANVARDLDGYEGNGAVFRNTIQVIRDAYYQAFRPAWEQAQEDMAKLYLDHYTRAELGALDDAIHRPEVGDSWSKGRILALALNWGNVDNRDRILNSARGRLTPDQVGALLRTLDGRDWDFVEASWKLIDQQWPAIREAHRRRSGIVPEKVEAAPFPVTLPDGTTRVIAGGYYPIRYDADRGGVKSTKDEATEFYESMTTSRFTKAQTKHGHVEARVGGGGRTVNLSLDVMSRHLHDVLRDLHLGDAVNQVHRTLQGPEFIEAVNAAGKAELHSALEVWLRDVATGELPAGAGLEKVAQLVRRNLSLAVLTFKVSTGLLQLTGLVQTASVIGRRNMAWGLWRFKEAPLAGPNSIWNYVDSASAMMRARNGEQVDAVMQMANARAGRMRATWAAAERMGWFMIARLQRIADVVTWLGAERKGLKEGMDLAAARAYADDIVIRAQSASDFIDKPSIIRGNLGQNVRQSELVKSLVPFMSYMLAKGNVAREKYQTTSFRSPAQTLRFGVDMVQLFALEAVLMALMKGGLPDDDDEDGWVLDDWLWFLGKETGMGALGTIPIISTLATEGRGYTSQSPLERAASISSRVSEQGAQVFTDGDGDGDPDGVDRAAVKAVIELSGVAVGAPSAQINTTLDAVWDRAEGEDVAPIDYLIRREKKAKEE